MIARQWAKRNAVSFGIENPHLSVDQLDELDQLEELEQSNEI